MYSNSPLLPIQEEESLSCRSTENIASRKREKYRVSKLNSMPIVSKFANRGKSKAYKIESEYTLMKTLGVGTYGEVKLASSVSDSSKLFAIKIVKGQTSIHMLKNEGEILKTLDNDCFPKFIDFKIDEFSNKAYLIIEYFEGKTLDKFLEESSFEEIEALNHLKLLSNAIKYLHSNKIAHRDLKPQNIIVTRDCKVKIIDFNISKKFIDRSFDEDEKNSKFEQKFFTQICSPMFAAPEILSTNCYSESIDIWGLGVVFVSMLLGIEIFEKCDFKTLSEIEISQTIKDKCRKASDRGVQIALTMLSKNSEERPTIEQLCSLLEE